MPQDEPSEVIVQLSGRGGSPQEIAAALAAVGGAISEAQKLGPSVLGAKSEKVLESGKFRDGLLDRGSRQFGG